MAISLPLLIPSYVLNVDWRVTFLTLAGYDFIDLPCKHRQISIIFFTSKVNSQLWEGSENLTRPAVSVHISTCSAHLGKPCDASVLIIWLRYRLTEIIRRSKLWYDGKGDFFFSIRKMTECYLASRYPPILLNNASHRLTTPMCWFVIWTDKLNSSVQVCLAGSLHDYVTLRQVHNSFLIFTMGVFLSSQTYSFFF